METRSIVKRRKMSKLPTASIEDLPEEITLQILTHLEFSDNASASQVCKRWKLLCEDQSIWQKINLSGRTVPAKFIEKALRLGCQYLGLNQSRITNLNFQDPNSFSASNQLKYLSISDDLLPYYGFSMKNLIGATQTLEKLSIERNWTNFQPNIIQNNQTLTVLRITGLISLSTEMVKVISTNCLELTEVSLDIGGGVSDEALSFFCNNLTSKIKKLDLFSNRFDMFKDEHVIAITNRCPSLEELALSGRGTHFSELALSAIIEKLQNLVKLRLPNSGGNFSEKVLLELGSMPNLKYLQVRFTKNLAIRSKMVKNLPNLKINEKPFKIADPDTSNQRLWDIQCKPTNDFYETF